MDAHGGSVLTNHHHNFIYVQEQSYLKIMEGYYHLCCWYPKSYSFSRLLRNFQLCELAIKLHITTQCPSHELLQMFSLFELDYSLLI